MLVQANLAVMSEAGALQHCSSLPNGKAMHAELAALNPPWWKKDGTVSICLSVYLLACVFMLACVSVYLPICLAIYLSAYLRICMFACLGGLLLRGREE